MTNISSIDGKQFRKALGSFTTGVTVVTARGADGKDVGLTANSFNSVSLEPPMVLWSLDKKSSNRQAFMDTDHFAVHILASDQEQISNRFAKSGIDRFADVKVERGHGDVPLLDGCSARFECRTTYRYDGGDHVIFVGEVLSFDSFEPRAAGLPRRQVRIAAEEGRRPRRCELELRRRLARLPARSCVLPDC